MEADRPRAKNRRGVDSMSNLQKLESLTIVILTLNRPRQVQAVVEFWSQLPVKLVVIDSSESPNYDLFGRPDVTYVHSRMPYLDNHGLAAEYVTSEYVICACDDELYVPTALVQCIEFLEENADFVAACGEAVGLHWNDSGPRWEEQYVRNRKYERTETFGAERFLKHLSAYRHVAFYSVSRSEQWVRAWKLVSAYEFSPFAAFEIQFEAALVSAGKIKVLPILMWVRNRFVPPMWSAGTGVAGLDPSISFNEWWFLETARVEKELFVQTMIGVLREMLPRSERYKSRQLDSLIRRGFSLFAGPRRRPPGISKRVRKRLFRIAKIIQSNLLRMLIGHDGVQPTRYAVNPAQQIELPAVPVESDDYGALSCLVGEGTRIDVFWLTSIGRTLLSESPSPEA